MRKLVLFVALVGLVGSGCWARGASEMNETVHPNAPERPTYLALGDSYTIGESVSSVERWPVLLASELDWSDSTIVAKTGWTSADLLLAMDRAELASSYDYVTLLIGVNDQFQGRPIEDFRADFRTLLGRAVAKAGNDGVLVVSIPDYGVTPFGQRRDPASIARAIDAFNAIVEAEAREAGVSFADITPISREAASNPDLIAADGLHPSGAMYARWVTEVIAPHFRR